MTDPHLPPAEFLEFPYKPYEIQLGFMRSLYFALENGGVACLESPTGTGKTISIICGALQWLEDHRQAAAAQQAAAQQQAAQALLAPGDPDWLQEAALQHVVRTSGGSSSGGGGDTLDQQRSALDQRRVRCRARKRRAAPTRGVVNLAAGSSPGDGADAQGGAEGSPGAPPGGYDAFLLEEAEEQPGGVQAAWDGLSSGEEEEAADRRRRQAEKAASQKTQFVSEVTRTGYSQRLALVALASRKVLCINSHVAHMGSAGLVNQTCLDMQQAPSKSKTGKKRGLSVMTAAGQDAGLTPPSGRCPYLHHEGAALEAWQDEVVSAPADVEDLVHMGRSMGVCPYYGSRSLVQEADVVLAPYAVVLQQESRQAVGLNLEGSVLIIDEAHNLVDALNGLHSHSVSGAELEAAQGMLAGYWERLGARLGPRNAQHVQLMQRVMDALRGALVPPASAEGPTPMLNTSGGGGVTSANSFLFQHELDDINMFELLAWVQESKIMSKLASYTKYCQGEAQPGQGPQATTTTSAAGGSSGVAAGTNNGNGSNRGNGGIGSSGSRAGGGSSGARGDAQGAQAGRAGGSRVLSSAAQRSERLSALQAVVGFLSALTNCDADGRILTLLPTRDKGDGGGGGAAGGQEEGCEGAQGQSSGCLKYILLSAATHFGKVLSSCRAVILASGTLAPVEGLAAQLFASSGLNLNTTPSTHLHLSAPGAPGHGLHPGTQAVVPSCAGPAPYTTAATHNHPAMYHPARLLGTMQGPASARPPVIPAHSPACPHQPAPASSSYGGTICNPGLSCSAAISCAATSTSGRDSGSGAAPAAAGGPSIPAPERPLLHYACGHVVPSSQVSVLVAGSGPTGVQLDLRHAHRATPTVMDEVGRLLLNMSRVVPGGMVVFVPSFAYLAQLTQHWQRTGMMQALGNRKAVFTEPRLAAEVEVTLRQYAAAVTAGSTTTQATPTITGQQAAMATDSCQVSPTAAGSTGSGRSVAVAAGAAGGSGSKGQMTGAMLLAVVGGKLSEGINFGDELGRCVVVLGLPYANPTCPELRERQAYLDRAAQQATTSPAGTSAGKENCMPCGSGAPTPATQASGSVAGQRMEAMLTGRQLYENCMMNSVNQCVGRVVRHKDDFAVVVLVDGRYVQPSMSGAQQAPRRHSTQVAPASSVSPVGLLPMHDGTPVSKLPAWMHASLDAPRVEFGYVFSRISRFFKSL